MGIDLLRFTRLGEHRWIGVSQPHEIIHLRAFPPIYRFPCLFFCQLTRSSIPYLVFSVTPVAHCLCNLPRSIKAPLILNMFPVKEIALLGLVFRLRLVGLEPWVKGQWLRSNSPKWPPVLRRSANRCSIEQCG